MTRMSTERLSGHAARLRCVETGAAARRNDEAEAARFEDILAERGGNVCGLNFEDGFHALVAQPRGDLG
ncbi:MAG: hypothetical protein ACK5Q5_24175 [Planctomycetaceae bacterium]